MHWIGWVAGPLLGMAGGAMLIYWQFLACLHTSCLVRHPCYMDPALPWCREGAQHWGPGMGGIVGTVAGALYVWLPSEARWLAGLMLTLFGGLAALHHLTLWTQRRRRLREPREESEELWRERHEERRVGLPYLDSYLWSGLLTACLLPAGVILGSGIFLPVPALLWLGLWKASKPKRKPLPPPETPPLLSLADGSEAARLPLPEGGVLIIEKIHHGASFLRDWLGRESFDSTGIIPEEQAPERAACKISIDWKVEGCSAWLEATVEDPEDAQPSRILGLPFPTLRNSRQLGDAWNFDDFPRRATTLRCRVRPIPVGERLLAVFDFPNPDPGPHPHWTPSPLPIAHTVGDLRITLHAFHQSPDGTRTAELEVSRNGRLLRAWRPRAAWVTDASGNGGGCGEPYFLWKEERLHVSLGSGSARDEVWKVGLAFENRDSADPDSADEVWETPPLPLPLPGEHLPLAHVTTLGWWRLELCGVYGADTPLPPEMRIQERSRYKESAFFMDRTYSKGPTLHLRLHHPRVHPQSLDAPRARQLETESWTPVTECQEGLWSYSVRNYFLPIQVPDGADEGGADNAGTVRFAFSARRRVAVEFVARATPVAP